MHQESVHLPQLRTIILLRDTAEELMMARFDLQLTNHQKGAFNSRPRAEIEYSSCLFIFLPLSENKNKPNSRLKKKNTKKEQFSNFSTFNVKSKNE